MKKETKKIFAASICALVASCAMATPTKHAVYEPDAPGLSGDFPNLFLNAKVTASGQFATYAPTYAVDGVRDGCDYYWAAEHLPQSLTVDMGEAKTLSCIRLYPFWADGRAYGFKIEGSVDGQNWKMLVDKTANSQCADSAGFTLTFDLAKVRYVRTTMTSNTRGPANGGHIVEIEGYTLSRKGGSFFLAGDIYTRYDRDKSVDTKTLAPVAKLTGWRGERVSAMLVASSIEGISEMLLSAGDPKARLDVLRYTLADGVLYGDILDGTEQTEFKGVTRPVVYTYDIPANASGVIRDYVTALINGVRHVVPVEITVVPRTLPPAKDWKFHLDIWQHPDAIARWHDVPYGSDDHMNILLKYNRILADMGQKVITTTIADEAWSGQTYDRFRSCVQVTKRTDGSWAYDYTVFDKVVESMMAVGITRQINCYGMLPWSLKFRYFDEKSGFSVAPVMHPGSAEYEDFWGSFLADFSRHLKEKGWYERTKIAMDERPDGLIRPVLALMAKYAPGMQLAMACNAPSKMNNEAFDVSYAYWHCGNLAQYAAERRAQGKFTTYYVCWIPERPNTLMRSAPAEAEWLAPFATAMGFDGFLRWAWCSWVANPLVPQDGTMTQGDTQLVYPGPRLSLRGILMRDGIETSEKIRILGGDIPALKAFTVERGGMKGVHADDVRALNAVVNAM